MEHDEVEGVSILLLYPHCGGVVSDVTVEQEGFAVREYALTVVYAGDNWKKANYFGGPQSYRSAMEWLTAVLTTGGPPSSCSAEIEELLPSLPLRPTLPPRADAGDRQSSKQLPRAPCFSPLPSLSPPFSLFSP
ncbi:hypothetical protein VPH35_050669 [Triticum aestivum]|uniref:Hypothetical gene predicted by FGENESH n=1 Tax=Triticum aestivum TaxID=4565 RepID=B4ERW3_WHEAT|nr:unnamed protein product [Triticum aestivum]